jgi:hypothetical protein
VLRLIDNNKTIAAGCIFSERNQLHCGYPVSYFLFCSLSTKLILSNSFLLSFQQHYLSNEIPDPRPSQRAEQNFVIHRYNRGAKIETLLYFFTELPESKKRNAIQSK